MAARDGNVAVPVKSRHSGFLPADGQIERGCARARAHVRQKKNHRQHRFIYSNLFPTAKPRARSRGLHGYAAIDVTILSQRESVIISIPLAAERETSDSSRSFPLGILLTSLSHTRGNSRESSRATIKHRRLQRATGENHRIAREELT